MCEKSVNDTNIISYWLQEFYRPAIIVPTEFGLCRIVNFAEPENFLQSEVDERRIFQEVYNFYDDIDPVDNGKQPLMTTSMNLGFSTMLVNNEQIGDFKKPDIDSFLLMIHSPYELPTNENQKFIISDLDRYMFDVTPQLNRIDNSMIAMEAKE